MIIENIVGTMSSVDAVNSIKNMSLYDLLKTGKYKDLILTDYFSEVMYIESDDALYIRTHAHRRINQSPVDYWYLSFDKEGNYLGEATSGFSRLYKDGALLHITATRSSVMADDYGRIHKSLQSIEVIGSYDMSSTKYKIADHDTSIISRTEYDEDGNIIKDNDEIEIDKSFYVPANDTASNVCKSAMYNLINKFKEGSINIPE